jgi:hypothetical protein
MSYRSEAASERRPSLRIRVVTGDLRSGEGPRRARATHNWPARGVAVGLCLAIAGVVNSNGVASDPGSEPRAARQPCDLPCQVEREVARQQQLDEGQQTECDLACHARILRDAAAAARKPPQSIHAALEELRFGSVAFNAPRTLQLDETKVIQLVMSRKQGLVELQGQLANIGRREAARIMASDVMEATIRGGGFRIESITPTRQPIGQDLTRWKWEVQPTRTGRYMLHVVLTALVYVRPRGAPMTSETEYAVKTYERPITVENVPAPWHGPATAFISGNWQFLLTTLVMPAGIWLYRRRSKTLRAPLDPEDTASDG